MKIFGKLFPVSAFFDEFLGAALLVMVILAVTDQVLPEIKKFDESI